MELNDVTLFVDENGKEFSYQNLLKDIYENTIEKRENINTVIDKLINELVKTPETAALISGIIPMYLQASIKNDDQLLKMANILNKLVQAGNGDDAAGSLLSDEEKQELMENFKVSQKESD